MDFAPPPGIRPQHAITRCSYLGPVSIEASLAGRLFKTVCQLLDLQHTRSHKQIVPFYSVSQVRSHNPSFKMHFVLLSALLVIAPALATVERRGYQPKRRAMSPEEIFGLAKRQTAGYEPGQTTCSGTGTCEQACGAGYAACGVDFCYLPASQVCCSSTSGTNLPKLSRD